MRRGRLLLVVVLVLAGVGLFTVLRGVPAAREALRARAALVRAEGHMAAGDLDQAQVELTAAKGALQRMGTQLDGLGPVLPVLRVVPVVRSHVRAVETFQSAGTTLTDAGVRLSEAAEQVMGTTQGAAPLGGALESLQAINSSLAEGAASVRRAAAQVKPLEGLWLLGPVDGARDDLVERLPRYERQAASSAEGVEALIRFLGGHGPRRYLFVSQNPDEIRPTGGFIGTYGVLTAAPGDLRLEQFEPVGKFRERHPNAPVPGPTPTALTFTDNPYLFPDALANGNATADFSQAGRLITQVWNGAGEPRVDGVVSFTPAFLARILGVLGPVDVPGYSETVTQSNLVERFEFFTQQSELDVSFDVTRKSFLGSLGEAVMRQLLAAPSAKWQPLADVVGRGFTAREAMGWSSDPVVQATLAKRGWDGVLPAASGDFFYNAEFVYPSKVSRGTLRTFDHHVQLRPNGSARITTTMRITNTRPHSPRFNPGAKSYVTLYGPKDAVLDPESDKPLKIEPSMAGHPAAGWLIDVPPLGTATLKVVWEVKGLVRRAGNGTLEYSLRWLRVPDHSGDVLNLRVYLPKGWRWKGAAPPARIELTQDVNATWTLRTGSFF